MRGLSLTQKMGVVLMCFAAFSCNNALGSGSIDSLITTNQIRSVIPQIIGSSITDGETNVTVGTPIEVYFSEYVTSISDLESNVSYLSSKGEIIPFRVELYGNSALIVAQRKLQPLESYTIEVYDDSIEFTNSDLDVGLYWYGAEGACEKYFAEYSNAFYSDSKPTMIYAHGWQSGSVSKIDHYGRSNFEFELFYWGENNFDGNSDYNGLSEWTNHGWLDKGWNTGMVYWNQFADEDSVYDAEEKIWSLNSNSNYKTLNLNGDIISLQWDKNYTFNGTTHTVSSIQEMLSIPVKHALANNYSGDIRIVGHSLGNQVATNITKNLTDSSIVVDRLALLDPAWTSYSKDYLPNDSYGDWTGARVRNFIFEMLDGNSLTSCEAYHTTALNMWTIVADSNDELVDRICDVDILPWYYSATQIDSKHISAIPHYMWSMEFDPPVECYISWWSRYKTGYDGPSAATSTSRIVNMMNSNYRWIQVEGRFSPTPDDDWFERKWR